MREDGPTRQGQKASVICLQRSEKHQISQVQTRRVNPERGRCLPPRPGEGEASTQGPCPLRSAAIKTQLPWEVVAAQLISTVN